MAGIVPVVNVPVITAAAAAAATAAMAMLMTALVMATAVQSPGLVMVLKIVKTKHGVVTLHALTMTAVTAKVAVAVAVKTVMTVNMILPRTALNAVILPGMNMVLIVRP